MLTILPYIQIILSVLLITGILLQRSEASLGASFGTDNATGGRFMRRGFERFVFNSTVVIAALFAITAFVSLLLNK